MTYYEVLGVSLKATTQQIKKAYRKKAFKNHPDRSKKRNAKELFQKIAQAYAILSNAISRKNYDLSIKDNATKVKQEVVFTKRAYFKYRLAIINLTTRIRKKHHMMHLTITRPVHIGDIMMGNRVRVNYKRCVRCTNCDYNGLVVTKIKMKKKTKVCPVCSGTTLVLKKEIVEVDLTKYRNGEMYIFKNMGHHGGVYGGKFDNTEKSRRLLGDLYVLFWVR